MTLLTNLVEINSYTHQNHIVLNEILAAIKALDFAPKSGHMTLEGEFDGIPGEFAGSYQVLPV